MKTFKCLTFSKADLTAPLSHYHFLFSGIFLTFLRAAGKIVTESKFLNNVEMSIRGS